MLKLFVKSGIDYKVRNSNRQTLLHLVITGDDEMRWKYNVQKTVQEMIEIIDYLINLGFDVNAVDKSGNTIMHYLSRKEYGNEIIEKIIKGGAKINVSRHDGMTPLLIACANGRLDLIKLLVNNGADMTARFSKGFNCFLKAIGQSNLDMVKFFRPHFDINSSAYNGEGPFHISFMFDNIELFDYLLNEGADINRLDNNGIHPLIEITRFHKERTPNLETILLKYYSKDENYNFRNENGQLLHEILESIGRFELASIFRSVRASTKYQLSRA